MAELLVHGPEPMQRWRRPIPLGEVIRLGRAPRSGWAVPWDALISREHAEMQLVSGQLRVRRLDAARNPIFYYEVDNSDFLVKPGEQFRIGRTVFQLVAAELGVGFSEQERSEELEEGDAYVDYEKFRRRISHLLDLLLDQHVNFRGPTCQLLQDELRSGHSPLLVELAARFRRVIVLETEFGMAPDRRFEMDRFLRLSWKRIAQAFELPFDPDTFHPEQIAQALKSEAPAVFCILDVQRLSEENLHRLRGLGFTQEHHHVLYVGSNPELGTMAYPVATPELEDVVAIVSSSSIAAFAPREESPEKTAALNEILLARQEESSLNAALTRAVWSLMRAIPDCQSTGVYLLAPGTNRVQLAASHLRSDENLPDEPDEDLLKHIFGLRKVSIISGHTFSVVWIPIWDSERQPLGVLWLTVRLRKIRAVDGDFLQSVAAALAQTVRDSRLRAAEVELERLRRELQSARSVQQSLFPSTRPPLRGYELADHHETSDFVGGDCLDFVSLGPGRVIVILGDVAGKGMSAAMSMVDLLATSRSSLQSQPTLAEALSAVNRESYARMGGDRFATLVFAEINIADHVLTFVNAGHFAPLMRHLDGNVESLGQVAAGLPIGIAPDSKYEAVSISFQPGETLLIYTDGIIEAMNSEQTIYGQERVKAVLASHQGDSSALVAKIAADIHNFTGNAKLSDDLCLVACTRLMMRQVSKWRFRFLTSPLRG